MLQITDLRTDYGKSRILQGVSLTVAAGEVTCLLGRNGVGKTTTLKSIMGLAPPRSGSVRLHGEELAGHAPHHIARAGIGWVPEERRIFPTLTVTENLLMGIKPGTAPAARRRIEDVLASFPALARRSGSRGRFLSGGEQQMLAIARALMGSPTVLLLDEPTEGLAPLIVEAVERVIQDLSARGLAILLVESKLAVALRAASRVSVMSKGQIVFEGSTEALARADDVRQRYLEV